MDSATQNSAVHAARAVATAGGLSVQRATVIAAHTNVLVRLEPADVVVRVMTGTAVLHPDPRRWLEREVSILRFLSPSGLAVQPARGIDPGPHLHDGHWLTFVEWVPDAAPMPQRGSAAVLTDPRRVGERLRELHDALGTYPGELWSLSDFAEVLAGLLDEVDPAVAEQRAGLRRKLDELMTCAFASKHPSQALHGDVSLRNLLDAPAELIWNDFEDTLRGPVHWDLASLLGSVRIHGGGDAAILAILDGYGWKDPAELAPFIAAQAVYDEIWALHSRFLG